MRLAATLLGLCACVAAAEPAVEPLPGLPPQPRPLLIETRPGTAPAPANADALGADLRALRESVQRVDAALATPAPDSVPAQIRPTAKSEDAQAAAQEPRRSSKFALLVTIGADGQPRITADITRQRLEAVYRELAGLLERPIDDAQVTVTQRLVTLQVNDLPWPEALDRLFGQVGIAWRDEGGVAGKLVIADIGRMPTAPRRDERAIAALNRASTADDSSLACAALYRLGEREATAGNHVAAIRRFSQLVGDFDQKRDAATRAWVMRAIRAIGDSMTAAGQPKEAVGVYRTYINRAEQGDRDLAAVYLAAGKAALAWSRQAGDSAAGDEAGTMLDGLVQRYGSDPGSATTIAEARLLLGELLFVRRRWQQAEDQLAGHVKAAHHEDPQVAYWRAECAYQLERFAEARPRFETLARAEPGAAGISRAEQAAAALRVGDCWMRQDPPEFARALFAYLRARQMHPRLTTAPEAVLAMARCYAELEMEEGAVDEFWRLFNDDRPDRRPPKDQLDEMLGSIETGLGQYDGPIRARVLFYIAQADWRQAWRNRKDRSVLVANAIQRYQRVLTELPSGDLRHAAQLGLARVAMLGGEHDMGVQVLLELLRETNVEPRDRQLAYQLLGDHYREQGKLREAIAAYEGRVP